MTTTQYTITETRVSIYPKGDLVPISAEAILRCWNSGDFSSSDGAFAIDVDENYESEPRMFSTLEEAEAAFATIRPQSITAEPAGAAVSHFDEDDERWAFRSVSIWALEEATYDEDGQCIERDRLAEKADECIA